MMYSPGRLRKKISDKGIYWFTSRAWGEFSILCATGAKQLICFSKTGIRMLSQEFEKGRKKKGQLVRGRISAVDGACMRTCPGVGG
jgi:hypothetical protein